jgi:hypothetical protein
MVTTGSTLTEGIIGIMPSIVITITIVAKLTTVTNF